MNDDGGAPVEGTSAEDDAARIGADVRRWCAEARIDAAAGLGDVELGDEPALLVAAGAVDEQTRSAVVARIRAGRAWPDTGGYTRLRRLVDERTEIAERSSGLPAPVRMLANARIGDLDRRLGAARSAWVGPGRAFASGVRSIRRDRREGVHLDPAEREQLFEALLRTPAPQRPTVMRRAVDSALGGAVLGGAVRRAGDFAQYMPKSVTDHLPPDWANPPRQDDSGHDRPATMRDRYECALFLAGVHADRVVRSRFWRSEHGLVPRGQLDVAGELVSIAVDTVELRSVAEDLDTIAAVADRGDDPWRGADRVAARRRALEPVWNQVVERVVALARISDVLSRLDSRIATQDAVDRVLDIDGRIDRLVSRAGTRELSVDNMDSLGRQLGIDETVQAYRAILGRDIAALTDRG
ncbi:hypothetical protein DW322_17850 [Rhodococcus rhodnii]|nr:hypothetical protein [Rhodococcus rhodnii]TXG91712.1 hypothetical protein DW322_17850 [Rhodococcus rhodnii]